MRFTSTSNNPYDLFIDGEYQLKIDGNSFLELDLPEEKYNGKVVQQSGFLLFPIIVEKTLNVFGCEESQWIFP